LFSISRIAAQIVSGIAFIRGLIFIQGDRVNRLTTAATLWPLTGVGMVRGAALRLLAIAFTAAYFMVAFAFPFVIVG
jgi:putative Mg2+ transporter-C (MgtC) family protein